MEITEIGRANVVYSRAPKRAPNVARSLRKLNINGPLLKRRTRLQAVRKRRCTGIAFAYNGALSQHYRSTIAALWAHNSRGGAGDRQDSNSCGRHARAGRLERPREALVIDAQSNIGHTLWTAC